ncbi:MAG: hypothetical protein JXB48_13165 [Candidatus Latescibacteria bacterium]|nr:hypothetical protein [Candidatus Latescibacterota bacterium]
MNEKIKPKIGLLPLMLELYQKSYPQLPEKQKPFIDHIRSNFQQFSNVFVARVCSTSADVRSAIREFEEDDVDGIVILFIAYSTSISALNPLLETTLPLLLFSTVPKNSMAEGMSSEDIILNHGVHGYMDLSNVLKRNKRRYQFVSGTIDDAMAMESIKLWAKAASVKKRLRQSIIGLAGYTFDGMGDFGIDTTLLNTNLGPEVRHVSLHEFGDAISGIEQKDLESEIQSDRQRFSIENNVDTVILNESNRVYLGLLKIVKDMGLNAFTMHFMGILENPQIRTLPFLAISKLQEKGLAYAGEGDLLGATANLLMRYLCGDTVFTETFCPDFDGGRIVMGHMGESNPAMGTVTTLLRKNFRFGKAIDPVVADVKMKEGTATVVNLGIGEDNKFQMILYKGEICEKIPGAGDVDMPYFHFKPDLALADFLTSYGLAGGTHHIAMTYGNRLRELDQLSEMLRIQCITLR